MQFWILQSSKYDLSVLLFFYRIFGLNLISKTLIHLHECHFKFYKNTVNTAFYGYVLLYWY